MGRAVGSRRFWVNPALCFHFQKRDLRVQIAVIRRENARVAERRRSRNRVAFDRRRRRDVRQNRRLGVVHCNYLRLRTRISAVIRRRPGAGQNEFAGANSSCFDLREGDDGRQIAVVRRENARISNRRRSGNGITFDGLRRRDVGQNGRLAVFYGDDLAGRTRISAVVGGGPGAGQNVFAGADSGRFDFQIGDDGRQIAVIGGENRRVGQADGRRGGNGIAFDGLSRRDV